MLTTSCLEGSSLSCITWVLSDQTKITKNPVTPNASKPLWEKTWIQAAQTHQLLFAIFKSESFTACSPDSLASRTAVQISPLQRPWLSLYFFLLFLKPLYMSIITQQEMWCCPKLIIQKFPHHQLNITLTSGKGAEKTNDRYINI